MNGSVVMQVYTNKGKRTTKSINSPQSFINDTKRRRDGIRKMIENTEIQLAALRSAESALSAQLAEYSPRINEKRDNNGRKK